jgi:hypothetical protein
MLSRLGFGDQSLHGAFPEVDFEKMKESKSSFGGIKAQETDLQERDDSDDDESEIEDDSSASDDKTQPNFWRTSNQYDSLPDHVKAAINVGKLKAKHSQFYYRMKDLNHKISLYKQIFDTRIPSYQRAFMKRQPLNK